MPFSILRQIAEERIREAMERGEFQCEEFKGKPLNLKDDPFVPEHLRVVYRMLKNAGFLPKEVELRKEICQTVEELLDEEHRDSLEKVRRLSALLFHLNQLKDRPLRVEEEDYYTKIAERIKKLKGVKEERQSRPKRIDFSQLQTLLSIKSFCRRAESSIRRSSR